MNKNVVFWLSLVSGLFILSATNICQAQEFNRNGSGLTSATPSSLAAGESTTATGAFITSSPSWVTQLSDATADLSLYDIEMIDERTGIAGGNQDHVYVTTERGNSWTFVTAPAGDTDFSVWAVSALDADNFVVAGSIYDPQTLGYSAAVYKTSDGGTSWTAISPDISPNEYMIYDIYYRDASTIYACGWAEGNRYPKYQFFKTTDGGNVWTSKIVSAVATTVYQMKVFEGASTSQDTIYAIINTIAPRGGSPVMPPYDIVVKSTDGGATFTSLADHYTSPFDANDTLYSLDFIDSSTGYVAAVNIFPGSTKIIKTTDGGSSWTLAGTLANTTGLRAQFHEVGNEIHGWLAALVTMDRSPTPVLLSTTDDSSTWTTHYPDLYNRNYYGLAYYNENNIWVAGGAGSGTEKGYVIAKYGVDPTLTSILPAGEPGQTLDVTFTGTNLQSNSSVDFGNDYIGPAASSASAVGNITPTVTGDSATSATARITIGPDTEPGQVTVTWTNEEDKGNLSRQATGTYTVLSASSTTTTTTTTTTTNTTIPSIILDSLDNTLVSVRRENSNVPETTNTLRGRYFRPNATVIFRNSRNGKELLITKTSVSSDGLAANVTIDTSSQSQMDLVGYYDVIIINDDGSSDTLQNAFIIEPAKGLFFYPTNVKANGFKASALTERPRIVYTLTDNKPVDLFVYDVRNMRVVFHRKYASGTTGGKMGYNEIFWDGVTDQGTTIPNGSYVLQAFSDGKMIGQTYFVVLE